MSQKILIAVDESEYSAKAVRHVANTVRPNEVEIVLMTVLPEAPGSKLEKEQSLIVTFKEKVAEMEAWALERRKLIESMLKEARETLKAAGVPEERINVRMEPKQAGVARDILAEARGGGYDVIVLGRRGVTGVKEFVFGSVSNKVLSMARNCAVWIVD